MDLHSPPPLFFFFFFCGVWTMESLLTWRSGTVQRGGVFWWPLKPYSKYKLALPWHLWIFGPMFSKCKHLKSHITGEKCYCPWVWWLSLSLTQPRYRINSHQQSNATVEKSFMWKVSKSNQKMDSKFKQCFFLKPVMQNKNTFFFFKPEVQSHLNFRWLK